MRRMTMQRTVRKPSPAGVRDMKLPGNPLAPLKRLAANQTGEIGLDLSNERANLVQLDDSTSGPVIRAAASLPYPCVRDELLTDPRHLKALLRQARGEHDFKGRRVVSCLRAAELQIFPVNYTLDEGRDDATAILGELRERLKGALDTSVIDYLPIRKEDGDSARREALVAVASREAVLRHLDLLENAGLQASAIDIGPAALARLVSFVNAKDRREQHPNTLVINFGSARSYLSVVWGRRLILDREIEFGDRPLVDRVVQILGMSEEMAGRLLHECGFRAEPAEDGGDPETAQTLMEVLRPELATLTAEVNKTLIYTASRSRGRSIDQVYLLGSVSRYPGIDRLIQEMLAVPVEVLNPLRAFGSPMRKANLGRLRSIAGISLACGLALRGFRQHD